MRILHVIPSISILRGGPSQAVKEMVTALRNSGAECEIATTNDDGQNLLEVETDSLIDYQGIPVRFFRRFSPNINSIREFAYSFGFQRWLKTNINNYDIIHVHAIFSFCSTYAMVLARKNNIPYIVRPIGQLENWALKQGEFKKSWYLSLVEKTNIINADYVHFTAESEKRQALDLFNNINSIVVPNGVTIPMQIREAGFKARERWNLDPHLPLIVTMSRLHPKKGIDLLIHALAQLHGLPFQLVIAGDGVSDYKVELENQVSSLNLTDKIHFVGFLKSAEKNLLLQGADLFALTSHSENFGIAVLEALASGTPALVSNKVALAELIKEHEFGFVCQLDDRSIQQQLNLALEQLELSRELGQKARLYIEDKYSWSTIAADLLTHYKKILSS